MEIRPELEAIGKPVERYKFSPEIEEDVLTVLSKTLPTRLRASDAKLEELYAKGYNQYKAGRYKEALPCFKLLIVAHPKEPRYMMAVAACCHMLKHYTEAGRFYNVASFLDPDNPKPQYYLADCCMHINNQPGAYIALEMALTRCKRSPGHKALQERVEVLLNGLKKNFEEKKQEGFTYFKSDPAVEEMIRNKHNKKSAKSPLK